MIKMVTIHDVDTNELIKEIALELEKKKEMKAPDWAQYVKTGVAKQRPPVNSNWWFVRAAAILRKISLKGPIGVSKLRTEYGSLKNRGYRPDKFMKGSGSIIRKALQQLDKAGLTKYVEKGVHKGRIITPEGQKLLDAAAKKVGNVTKSTVEKKEKPVKAQPAEKAEKKTEEKKAPRAKK